jgi:hypothetical protein
MSEFLLVMRSFVQLFPGCSLTLPTGEWAIALLHAANRIIICFLSSYNISKDQVHMIDSRAVARRGCNSSYREIQTKLFSSASRRPNSFIWKCYNSSYLRSVSIQHEYAEKRCGNVTFTRPLPIECASLLLLISPASYTAHLTGLLTVRKANFQKPAQRYWSPALLSVGYHIGILYKYWTA